MFVVRFLCVLCMVSDGFCMVSAWFLHGLWMVSVYFLNGFCMDFDGFCMVFAWFLDGFCMVMSLYAQASSICQEVLT